MGEAITTVGDLAGLCGHDGTDWEKVKINASKQLEVEVKTLADPSNLDIAISALRDAIVGTGAEIGNLGELETLLTEIQARLGDETSPASGTVNKQLADILTELEAKLETDDLNLDGTKDIQVDVKTLPGSGLQLRRGDHVSASYDAVPGDTDVHDLINVSGAGVLEWANLASDHSLSRIYITLDGAPTYAMYTITPTDVAYHSPLYYVSGIGEGSLFKLNVYDTDTDEYSIFLKRPLWFNTSLKVQYKASTAADKVVCNAGYHLF